MKETPHQDPAKIFKALADQSRLEIIRMLSGDSLCVQALVRRLRISQPAVSQHLRVLREAGLIRGEKKGYWVHYSLQSSLPDILKRAIAEILDQPQNQPRQPTGYLAGIGKGSESE